MDGKIEFGKRSNFRYYSDSFLDKTENLFFRKGMASMEHKTTPGSFFLHRILPVLGGLVLGYLFYYFVLMEVVTVFSARAVYYLVSVVALAGSVVVWMILLGWVINRSISKKLFVTLCIFYFAGLLLVLFGRRSIGRTWIWNPLEGLLQAVSGWQMGIQSLLNLLMFLPMGYFMRRLRYAGMLACALALSFGVELIQVFTMRGFFDTFDILLYLIGMHLGYWIFRRWKLPIRSK